jgi:hypothetical protein
VTEDSIADVDLAAKEKDDNKRVQDRITFLMINELAIQKNLSKNAY